MGLGNALLGEKSLEVLNQEEKMIQSKGMRMNQLAIHVTQLLEISPKEAGRAHLKKWSLSKLCML